MFFVDVILFISFLLGRVFFFGSSRDGVILERRNMISFGSLSKFMKISGEDALF